MDYTKFQVEDFVADAYFIKWVKQPTHEHVAFWSAFISKHPECNPRIEEARQIILLLDIKEDILPEGKFIEMWESIGLEKEAGVPLKLKQGSNTARKGKLAWFYRIAAVLVISVGCALGYYHFVDQTITIATSFGESRALFLPDGSKVTLNSNSSIQYNPNNFSQHAREVLLSGEAFFSIVHKSDDQSFRVHTNELHVEVLGTKFNVNSRRGTTRVVLQEGKVKLDLDSSSEPQMLMKPGDLVEFTEQSEITVTRQVDAADYTAWRNNQLVFARTSLREIAQLLEDNYGYSVKFEDPAMAERNFTGTSSSENLDELFEKLSIVFGLDIEEESGTLLIRYKE